MENLEEIGKRVKNSTKILNNMGSIEKNIILRKVAEEIIKSQKEILIANEKDIENAIKNSMKESLIDRLKLDEKRIIAMSDGLIKIRDLEDPIGEIIEGKRVKNGLEILKKRVPLGVIAIIYESRPNVTLDAFGLCFKTGNAVILRGGKDAINTNIAIIKVIRNVLKESKISEDCVYLIEDTSREKSQELMRLNKYVDVLIPRGGAGLIKTVVENSTIPVIETGTGNCHIYVDEFADFEMALSIIENAKTQRTGVCNACESLVIHKAIAKEFIPLVVQRLSNKNVEIRGDEDSCNISDKIIKATESDWSEEYLDLIISVKTVNNIDEAIEHISNYSTKHSESIITNNYENMQKFLNEIDSSCVYVNASTRFTDGSEFGLGAEIGISTQKLHARGPMGLKELTTTKYIIHGNGQIR
jgi:glutamate-5-semialdehyde dehydrogenase